MALPGLFLRYDFELFFDEKNHIHSIDGIPVPGVTTITDLCPKKALVPWAAKEVTICAEVEFKAILDRNLPITIKDVRTVLQFAKSAFRRKANKAAEKGTAAHAWYEEYIKTGIAPPIPEDEQIKSSILAFLEWEKAHSVQWIDSERQVGSKTHGFCGILDAFGVIDGNPSLIDFKTNNGIYESMYIQTAGYQIALEEGGCPPFKDRWILRFPKDGSGFEARKVPTSFEQDKQTFLCLLRAYQCLKGYEAIL